VSYTDGQALDNREGQDVRDMRKKVHGSRAARSPANQARRTRQTSRGDLQEGSPRTVEIQSLDGAAAAVDLGALNSGAEVETEHVDTAPDTGADSTADMELDSLRGAPAAPAAVIPPPPIDGQGLLALGDLCCSLACDIAPGGKLAPQEARALTKGERALVAPFAEMSAPALAKYAADFSQWAPYAFGLVLGVIVWGRWKMCAKLEAASEPEPSAPRATNGAEHPAPSPASGPSLTERYPGSPY
jgi:hypothetical protein